MSWISQVEVLARYGVDLDIKGDGNWECTAARGNVPAWSGHWERYEGNIVLYFTEPPPNHFHTNTVHEWLDFHAFEPSSALVNTEMRGFVLYPMQGGLDGGGWAFFAKVTNLIWSGAEGYILNHVQKHIRLGR